MSQFEDLPVTEDIDFDFGPPLPEPEALAAPHDTYEAVLQGALGYLQRQSEVIATIDEAKRELPGFMYAALKVGVSVIEVSKATGQAPRDVRTMAETWKFSRPIDKLFPDILEDRRDFVEIMEGIAARRMLMHQLPAAEYERHVAVAQLRQLGLSWKQVAELTSLDSAKAAESRWGRPPKERYTTKSSASEQRSPESEAAKDQ